jgi:anti-sigma28 factor (negative regulator of flagellin synthesis)
MKVNSASEIRPVSTRKADEAAGSSAAGRTQAPPDRISTEESAKLAAAIATIRSQASAARAAQLQTIETAVRQGTYRPDPARIAQQILQDAEISAAFQAMLKK